jgi:hypothetical protein
VKLLLVAASVLLLGTAAARGAASEYRVARAGVDRTVLLDGNDAGWDAAASIAWGPPAYETRFRALWSEAGLHLRFDSTDPSPWHTMTKRDEHLWEEEVVEIFLDLDRSGRQYYELEINPANVVCDLRMIAPWPDKEGDIDWNLEGLETRVLPLVDGQGKKTGWTATAFLPWSGFSSLPSARTIALPPKKGDAWRFNVFRIKRPGGSKEPATDAVFAAWSPPSVPSFHSPDAFRDFVFE